MVCVTVRNYDRGTVDISACRPLLPDASSHSRRPETKTVTVESPSDPGLAGPPPSLTVCLSLSWPARRWCQSATADLPAAPAGL